MDKQQLPLIAKTTKRQRQRLKNNNKKKQRKATQKVVVVSFIKTPGVKSFVSPPPLTTISQNECWLLRSKLGDLLARKRAHVLSEKELAFISTYLNDNENEFKWVRKKDKDNRNNTYFRLGNYEVQGHNKIKTAPDTERHPKLTHLVAKLGRKIANICHDDVHLRAALEELTQATKLQLQFTISACIYVTRLRSNEEGLKNNDLKGVHKDGFDYCGSFVVPLGEFSGGNLYFPDYQQRIVLRPGEFLFFSSSNISHCNEPVSGTRYSLVFATHSRYHAITHSQD